ncbi:MAG TPA: MFS transporter [Marmoricola sp.]|nr:MFS transporter [Marmoricola sp.]
MALSSPTAERQRSRAARLLVVLGIVVLAFNLRPAAVSVGPVLGEIRDGLGMSPTVAGVLTTLPVLAFAGIGALAPALARALGAHRVTLLALLSVVVGLALRPWTHLIWLFLLLSLLALAGMATANVLLPSLVKLHFPDRVGRMTAIYTTGLAVGLTASSMLTVPISHQFGGPGGWRFGLVVWAGTAAIAALPWLGLLRHDRTPEEAPHRWGLAEVGRTRLGWAMAVFFGLQSLQAYSIFGWFAQIYRDAGFSASTAGVLLGVITGASIPLSLVVPTLTGRVRDPRGLLLALMACYPVGYLGLMLAPVGGAWLWAVVVGVGTCTFPFVLTLIGLRARTSAGTAALSGFTQSVGYLLASVGPVGVGWLHGLTGGWTVPLAVLLALCVPQVAVGWYAARPRYVEDELPERTSGDW